MLAYTVDAAKESKLIDKIYVSTDDHEIAQLSKILGVEVLNRASDAANDSAPMKMVILDMVDKLQEEVVSENPFVIILQPTSPLRNGAHIDAAFNCASDLNSDVCISVYELKQTPFKSFVLNDEGRLLSLFPQGMTNSNRQDLKKTYYPNGAIYIFPILEFLKQEEIPSNGGAAFIMSAEESVDIDSEDDIARLEMMCLKNST